MDQFDENTRTAEKVVEYLNCIPEEERLRAIRVMAVALDGATGRAVDRRVKEIEERLSAYDLVLKKGDPTP